MAGTSETLTSKDVRIFLNDFPKANRLSGEAEFDPVRIQKAIKFVIDQWNETPPITRRYTDEDFPYKSCLLYGVVGWLFMGEATFQERNHLVYQSGGLSVDDDNSAAAYLNFANYFMGLFREQMKIQKMSENLKLGWGTINSSYRGYEGYW